MKITYVILIVICVIAGLLLGGIIAANVTDNPSVQKIICVTLGLVAYYLAKDKLKKWLHVE